MATVSLSIESAPLATALPAWWRMRHPYLLAGMAVLQIAAARGGFKLMDWMTAQWLSEGIVGALLAQTFLLGLWGALGGLRTLPRWGIVGLIHVTGAAATSIGMSGPSDSSTVQSLEMGLLGAVLVLVFAAALLPLRGLAGWRVDFDRRFYRHVQGRRCQLSFLDFAGYSVGVAAALTAIRVSLQAEVFDTGTLVVVMGVTAGVLVCAGPIAYLLLVSRRLWLALLMAAVWTAAVAVGNSWLALLYQPFDFFESPSPEIAGVRLHLVAFYTGLSLLVISTLAPLRLFGLQVIAVPLPETESA